MAAAACMGGGQGRVPVQAEAQPAGGGAALRASRGLHSRSHSPQASTEESAQWMPAVEAQTPAQDNKRLNEMVCTCCSTAADLEAATLVVMRARCHVPMC